MPLSSSSSSSLKGIQRALKFFEIVTSPSNQTFDKLPLMHCKNLTSVKTEKGERGIRCDLYVHESLCNRFGTLHGGCIATLVDVLTTCALLVEDENSEKGGGVTTDLQISCVKSARMHTSVRCEAVAKRLGKTMGFSTCEIRDQEGGVVAMGSHTKFLGVTGPKL
jgi:acyl-coenzyme A thioesterase 13